MDGSKFKAVNSGERHSSGNKLERRLKELDHKVERYLEELDRADRSEEDSVVDKEQLKQKIEKLKERKGRYEELLKELKTTGQSQVSLTDPDSRAMALTPRGEVSYNVQTAVDQKHHLIVAQEVTNEVLDNHQLFTMAQRTRQSLGQKELQVVADMGYYNHEELKRCEEAGITTYVSKPLVSKNTARGLFGKEKFVYEPTGTVTGVRLRSGWIFVLRLRRKTRSFATTGPKLARAVRSKPSVPPTLGFAASSVGSTKGF